MSFEFDVNTVDWDNTLSTEQAGHFDDSKASKIQYAHLSVT